MTSQIELLLNKVNQATKTAVTMNVVFLSEFVSPMSGTHTFGIFSLYTCYKAVIDRRWDAHFPSLTTPEAVNVANFGLVAISHVLDHGTSSVPSLMNDRIDRGLKDIGAEALN